MPSWQSRLGCTLAIAILLWSSALFAHPWGGLVVDAKGNIYFTFTCPVEGDSHVACVYRIDAGESVPGPVLVASSDPSDLVLARSPSRTIYAAERVGSEPFRTRLWKLSPDATATEIVPFSPPERFSADPYAVSDKGQVFFAFNGRVVAFDKPELTEALAASLAAGDVETGARSIRLMQALQDDGLMLVNGETLVLLTPDKPAKTVAERLREESPPELPFRGANILFDLAVDGDATLLAYYGNREVIRIEGDGKRSSLLKAEALWSPHGIDELNGTIYVLESTTPPPAWKVWQSNSLVPRVRRISEDGTVDVIYSYEPGEEPGE